MQQQERRKMDCFAALAMTVVFGCLKIEQGIRVRSTLNVRHKTHPSCPDLIRASINLRKTVFEED
jgi:hypothetical protein